MATPEVGGNCIRPGNGSTCVIFIHGILSSSEQAWTNSNGTSWPSLLAAETTLIDVAIYTFGYRSEVFAQNYSLGDVVDSLREFFNLKNLWAVPKLIFVCHSMGGIVARRFLVANQAEFMHRHSQLGLFLVASPCLGSRDANALYIFARLIGNSQAEALRFSQSNTWLNDLDKDFLAFKQSPELSLIGKELVEDEPIRIKKYLGLRTQVVEPFSAARYFIESIKIPYSDHLSIAKPENNQALQHQLLVKFISGLLAASPVTPPEEAAAAKARLDSFLALLRQRADTYACGLADVIAKLNHASPSDQSEKAQAAAKELQALRDRFLSLVDKHLAALAANDLLLTHELEGDIHDLQSDAQRIIGSRSGEIANSWSAIGRRYIDSPMPGEDPSYDSLLRDIARLNHDTTDRLQTLPYPCPPE
jgi:pimeloyl-ACP methyl ester carboxylesterase